MKQQERTLDRGLPASIDAERAILGACLLDNFALSQAEESLRADHFSLDSHRRIYLRMLELSERNVAIDFVTLTEELQQHREVEAVGGVAYITSLTDGLPRVKNISQYVEIVRDKAILRDLIHAAGNVIQQAYEQESSCADIVSLAEAAILQISEQRVTSGLISAGQAARESIGSVDKLYESGQQITGLATQYDDLDQMTSGLQKQELIILAARPGVGKSAFSLNIAENVSVLDQKVTALFSLEMSRKSLILRLMCSLARIDSHRLRCGFLNRDDFARLAAALGKIVESQLFIDDTAGISLSELRAKCRRLKQTLGRLDLVIVDYLQLMGTPAGKESRQEKVAALSRGLKGLAKDLDAPVIALSQLNRATEQRSGNNRPQLSDLRESGAIEQDADLVAFLFREEMYRPDDPDLEGKAELIIAKQRSGPTGVVHLAFIKRCTRFEMLARDFDPPGDYRRSSAE